MLEILERITAGEGKPEDLAEIRYLANGMEQGSLCALGQLAPAPVMSTLRHFEDEYRAHIEEERCPGGKCKALITYEIIAELCTGCMVCGRSCASNAISGVKKEPHVIDPELCERCGLCVEVCKFDAIVVK
jgi:ferredoxin